MAHYLDSDLNGGGVRDLRPSDDQIFRINHVVRVVESETGMDKFDLSSRCVLLFIAEAESDRMAMRVSDVVTGTGIDTPPTVYSRLAVLERTGWIKCVRHPQDGRAKHVRLTPFAHHAFARMCARIQKMLLTKSRN